MAAYRILQGLPYEIPVFSFIELPEAELEKFHGVYRSSQIPLKLTISHKGKTLTIQATDQPPIEMETISANRFSNSRIGAMIEFSASQEGLIHELVLKQGGAEILFKKE